MKTHTLVAAAILSITTAAFAQGEASYVYPNAAASGKTRAEVKAELRQAIAQGHRVGAEAEYSIPFASAPRTAQNTTARVVTIANSDALPLNVEAISFDGRTQAQRAQVRDNAAVLAQARK